MGVLASADPIGAQTAQPPFRPADRPPELPQYLSPKNAEALRLPQATVSSATASAGRGEQRIESFVFEGNTVVPDTDLQRLSERYAHRPVTSAELEDLRLRITRLYVDRGFVNSGALIPESALRDGVFTFRIVEGHINEVRVRGQERLREGYIAERLMESSDEVLNVNTLEDRFRLLLTDPMISTMSGRIVPRAALGEALLDVEVTRARPYRLSVFSNNYRPPSIGANALGLSGTAWNLTGLGDALDATALASEGAERYVVGWNVPVPRLRTILDVRHDRGTAKVVEEPIRSVDIVSKAEALDLGARQPLIETLSERLVIGLTWTRRESQTTLLGEPFSFTPGEPEGVSRLYAWRFWLEYAQRWPEQVLALRSTLSVGRNNVLDDTDPQLRAPQPEYRVWLGQAQYAHRLPPEGAQMVLKATVQLSRDRLLPMERMAVGGVATVRGYRENQFVRDEGCAGSVELHFPVLDPQESRHRVVLVPFVDVGAARNQGEATGRLRSAGLGLTWRLGGFDLELYAAAKLEKSSVRGSGDLQDHGVHFQLRYELP